MRFLSGIERALTAADYALLLQLVPGGAAAALPAYERLAAAGRVDGFLLTDVEVDDPRFALLEAAGVPVVLAGRPVGARARSRGWRRATTRGWRAPVEHLAALGHERIAFFGGRADFEHVQVRLARWRAAVAAAGLAEGPVVHADDDAARGGAGAAGRRADRGRLRQRRARDGGRRRRRASAGSTCPATSR